MHGGDGAAYGELMLARGIADYRRMASGDPDEPVFFDRGIAELAGYWRLLGLPVPPHVREAAAEYRTNALVFLAPPWPEIYRQDSERHQDWAEAVRTFELVRDAYAEAGYRTVEIPKDTLVRRVSFVSGPRGRCDGCRPALGQPQPAMLGEMAEILVARNQRHVVIDAGLCDQRVGGLGLQAFPHKKTPRLPRARPVAVQYFRRGNWTRSLSSRRSEDALLMSSVSTIGGSASSALAIAPAMKSRSRPRFSTRQVCDHCARVGRNHSRS